MSAVSLDRFDLDDLDLDALGACTAEPFRHVRQSIDDRVASGAHAGLRFTFADPATATDVTATHPWAQSLVEPDVPTFPRQPDRWAHRAKAGWLGLPLPTTMSLFGGRSDS